MRTWGCGGIISPVIESALTLFFDPLGRPRFLGTTTPSKEGGSYRQKKKKKNAFEFLLFSTKVNMFQSKDSNLTSDL